MTITLKNENEIQNVTITDARIGKHAALMKTGPQSNETFFPRDFKMLADYYGSTQTNSGLQ